MSEFGFQSTAEDVAEGIDLSGRRAVITGASSGLGVETARVLASRGAAVLMVARDAAKLEAAVAEVRESVPAATLDTALLDLADLDSVRAGAADILQKAPVINLLVNNAGVMACPLSRTAQGFEMQFGTNHLGHFLLTGLLAPALLAGAPARVVNLSSAGHRFAPVDMDDPNYQQREYDKWQSYGQSKTANALFSVGLDQRLREHGVRAFAVHPGMIMTELGRHMEASDFELIARGRKPEELPFKSVAQGSATSVWAATSPDLDGKGGLYLEDCHVAEPATAEAEGGVEAYALDPGEADKLWQLSEALVGQRFNFKE
ncbi:SDR family NAD(P)-dependent oxidoreductase [Pseudohalioglobus sediminis]|uniref:Probable oxidoreductase n=1 Tax=Pseudohalioglobus sediminis TaxID=2606449 RepID=A0A5B0WPH2_9GAMM|nr:SDR family NAD(P)-dependent oxidoreductase [Pseudohalioglobus sediminis]KAA1188984.1 SDR family NAD(P)-dependent oxidoreductase [Pseudohalioglobus sediminis]